MSSFDIVPKKEYLRGILLHYFIFKKSAAEAHRILVETYHALLETICKDWFRRSKNNDFDIEDKTLAHRKNLKTKNWGHYFMNTHTLPELAESLGVDHTTI